TGDNGVIRQQIAPVNGVDPATGVGVRVADGMIRTVDLESGAETDLAPVPDDEVWHEAVVSAASIGGGTVAVAQQFSTSSSRLLAIRPGSAPLLIHQGETPISRLSVAPDGRSVVAQLDGDLYRYPMP
ncbi:MAG TPA: hypothetical protein PLL69_01395, partial [Gemmatimonadales bacterium]|nr:hypothetical protein [Gemmatimonadales bacterium]